MAGNYFPIPAFHNDSVDVVFLDPLQPTGAGFVHYAYAIAAGTNADNRRKVTWTELQSFTDDSYQQRHPATINRLRENRGYLPGEMVLATDGPSAVSDMNTTMRLGGLELLGNISGGRLSASSKDPFPHQLALQQHMRGRATRRVLIADEVGLGKTIEAGLILRDILLEVGTLAQFSCLYLTSGGLVEDAALKLAEVLRGTLDSTNLVQPVESFLSYGRGSTLGVHVASMHAARLYAADARQWQLPVSVAPNVVVIDECHHAACSSDLAGRDVARCADTKTYLAVWKLILGSYWQGSAPPQIVLLMSATPFRSRPQFVNLLRLLVDGVAVDGGITNAFSASCDDQRLLDLVKSDATGVDVIWRRQTDDEVRSWGGDRLFPELEVVRPHEVTDGSDERLCSPGHGFIELVDQIKKTVKNVCREHGRPFGGFATFQLEKKLTSSSLAGACWLFAWCVRHQTWTTKEEFRDDRSSGTSALRQLIKAISRRVAEFSDSTARHADVYFASESFRFTAASLAQAQHVADIYDFSKRLRDQNDDQMQTNHRFDLSDEETSRLCALAMQFLDFGRCNDENEPTSAIEDTKLVWLRKMLDRHPDSKFLLFTESLQTCEVLGRALGSAAEQLVGKMTPAERREAVRRLQRNPSTRVLVATSAADEGFDLQVASKVVHWDLSSSPATLMQRNGRVARLGQHVNVTAYYLILPGTHEERRDSKLRDNFSLLGIDDESLRHRILGMLSDDEINALEDEIDALEDEIDADTNPALIGDLLRKAKQDNEEMEDRLQALRREVAATAVLDRGQLATRLQAWADMGLPDEAKIDMSLDVVTWVRPTFGAANTGVEVESRVASLSRETLGGTATTHVVFDPEFQVFGGDINTNYELAGLRPWTRTADDHGRVRVRPDAAVDFVGDLIRTLVRLPAADLARIRHEFLPKRFHGCAWLLFCTHPLRDIERVGPGGEKRPYLTFYGFKSDARPRMDSFASATEVHDVISALESQAVGRDNSFSEPTQQDLQKIREYGQAAHGWLLEHIKYFREDFLADSEYLLPIPVALLLVVDG